MTTEWNGDLVTMTANAYIRISALSWIGLSTRKWDASMLQRGDVIEKYIGIDSDSVMDIGSNLGYFVLRLV